MNIANTILRGPDGFRYMDGGYIVLLFGTHFQMSFSIYYTTNHMTRNFYN